MKRKFDFQGVGNQILTNDKVRIAKPKDSYASCLSKVRSVCTRVLVDKALYCILLVT